MKSVALGEVADLIRGVTFKPGDVVQPGAEGATTVMRTKNVQEQLDLSDRIAIPSHLVRRDAQLLREGDTLISSANSWERVGKACWVPRLPEPTAIGGFVTGLRSTSASLDPRYLYYWFTSPRTQTTVRSFGNKTTNISNLNLKRTAELEIPLPPMEEQRRIAAILDQADALRAKRSVAIALLDDLTQSIFTEMFGDVPPTTPLGDLVLSMRNGLSPSTKGTVHAQVLTLTAVTRGGFDSSAAKEGMFEHEPPAEQRVRRTDLLVCRGNGNLALVGRGVVPSRDHPDLVFPDTIIAATLDERVVNRPFAEVAWRQPAVRRQIEAAARTTSGIHKVSQGTLSKVCVPVPPMAAQALFGSRLEEVDLARDRAKAAVRWTDSLYVSLQARAFSGRL